MPPTRRMLHMRLMPQAAKGSAASQAGIVVDFDASVQGLGSLDAAAYRLIGTATCQIDRVADRYVCHLIPSANPQKSAVSSPDDLKERFLNLVADENLRVRVAEKTEGVRNVILALAFGSVAASQKDVV
jgi:His-Xaa-Ser system protein HxsD